MGKLFVKINIHKEINRIKNRNANVNKPVIRRVWRENSDYHISGAYDLVAVHNHKVYAKQRHKQSDDPVRRHTLKTDIKNFEVIPVNR